MKSKLLITSVSLFLASCGVIPIDVPIKVYNVNNGDVFQAVFKWTGRKGNITAVSPSGENCSGEYFTESRDTVAYGTSWGNIYGYGISGFSSSSGSYSISAGSEKGTAILRCEDRNVIQCEYVVNRNNQGTGFCKDNLRNYYRFNY